MSTVCVRLIRFGTGPRHLRLLRIWKALDASLPWLSVKWLHHNGTHAEGLRQNFERGAGGARTLILTEEDFLPTPDALKEIGSCGFAVGCSYRMRNNVGTLQPAINTWGGWFMSFPATMLERHPELDFGGKDPGNRIQQQLEIDGVLHQTYAGQDCLLDYDPHYGVRYPFGVHLFWSRHLHDDPSRVISGVVLGKMQECHDRAVEDYIKYASQHIPGFKKNYEALCSNAPCASARGLPELHYGAVSKAGRSH